jgi:hypothetical protein
MTKRRSTGDSLARDPRFFKDRIISKKLWQSRPFSAPIMSRSCFVSFPVCVYTFSSHYLNNIIFIENSLGPLARESPYVKYCDVIIYSVSEQRPVASCCEHLSEKICRVADHLLMCQERSCLNEELVFAYVPIDNLTLSSHKLSTLYGHSYHFMYFKYTVPTNIVTTP